MNNILYKIKPAYIIILFFIIVISVISFTIYQKVDQTGKIQISINLVPKDSKITIGNNQYTNGLNYIAPGEYKITVQKDGFETKKVVKKLIKDNDKVNISLIAQSEEAKKWAVINKAQYSDFENMVAKDTQEKGITFQQINPITKNLPFKNYLFSIGYKNDSSDKTGNSIIITISTSPQYRQSAISQIERWGYNLADYNYEFSGFNNPFKI